MISRHFNYKLLFRVAFGMALCLITIAASFFTASAQFLRIELDVESELNAHNIHALNFGFLQEDISELNLGDNGVGIFSIAGYKGNYINININAPEYLVHSSITSDNRILLDLKAAYANHGVEDHTTAIPLSGLSGRYAVRDRSGESRPYNPTMEHSWLYLYGEINTAGAPEGRYLGTVTIRLEYE